MWRVVEMEVFELLPKEVCRARRQCNTEATRAGASMQASFVTQPMIKMSLISRRTMSAVSDIKLIRTDTTLDLSQKAEKV